MAKTIQERLQEIREKQAARRNIGRKNRIKIQPVDSAENILSGASEGGAAVRASVAKSTGGRRKNIQKITREGAEAGGMAKPGVDPASEPPQDRPQDNPGQGFEGEADAWTAPAEFLKPEPVPENPGKPRSWHEGKTALWPDLRPISELRSIEKSDPAMFELMYQGNTNHGSASLFPADGWKLCDVGDFRREDVVLKLLSLDTALTSDEKNDAGGCVEILLLGSGEIIVSFAELFRLDFPGLVDYTKQVFLGYRPNYILVEDASSGKSLCQTLLASHPFLPIIPRKVKQEGTKSNSKVARAMAVTPLVRMGRIRLLRGDWNRKFIAQFAAFKSGSKHDEWVDCLSQGVRYLQEQELINRDAALLTAFSNPGYGLDPEAAAEIGGRVKENRGVMETGLGLGITGPGFIEIEIEIPRPGLHGIPGLGFGGGAGVSDWEW